MPDYVTLSDLIAKLSLAQITDACDDDKDGAADSDVVAAICLQATTKVNSYLEQRYTVPIVAADYDDVMPSIVTRAAVIFALVDIYARRGVELTKDLAKDLADVIAQLEAIRDGEAPLVAGATASGVGEAITEDVSVDTTLA